MVKIWRWIDVEPQFDWKSVLLGNGFSVNIWPGFAYASLRENAGLKPQIIDLIDESNPDFEATLRILEVVAEVVGPSCTDVLGLKNEVQDSLVRAIIAVHPRQGSLPSDVLVKVGKALNAYAHHYTLNFDLLAELAVSACNASGATRIDHLHGAINLLAGGGAPLSFADSLTDDRQRLMIIDGWSALKHHGFPESGYINDVAQRLKCDRNNLVVFGASLPLGDDHVTDMLKGGPRRAIAISVYRNGMDDNTCGRLVGALKPHDVLFFDAESHPLGLPV